MPWWVWLIVIPFFPSWVAVGAMVYVLYIKELARRYRHHKQQKLFQRQLKAVATVEDIMDR